MATSASGSSRLRVTATGRERSSGSGSSIGQKQRRASRYLSPMSCSQLLFIVMQNGCLDDILSLGVERDGTDGLPVACVPTPARRMSLAGLS